ncbi:MULTISPECIES: MOSC domain-containing protein [Actinoplanes]|uniref:MOSC domain-containing protein n=1 Tax=Actinoplanes TaxID=1865 RepID=UPI0005F2F23A|nr:MULTISPECIES: MOSC domain-containing protein [Actinoplanes]GLY01493.1 MOSC domain-containing protein [Actinoplanes sp. NBRC 101535]
MSAETGTVVAVSGNDVYSFTKPTRDEIVLLAGLGVEGDVHAGVNVRHRHRVRMDPTQPNLRQVHLIHAELFDEVGEKGYDVPAGGLGENVTTSGIDLLGLPRGTILRFGVAEGPGAADGTGPVGAVLAAAAAATLDAENERAAAAVSAALERDARDGDGRPTLVLAGLRNPCQQINGFRSGLLKEVIGRDGDGNPVRKAGVMAVVLRGGTIRPGDPVTVERPPGVPEPLERI